MTEIGNNPKIKQCDVLVIGGGGSGALAALEASGHPSLKVILASKGPIGHSGLTPTANGGTKAIGTPDDLFRDMVTAGRFLNDQDLVWFMVNEIQNSLEKLKHLGIPVTPLRAKATSGKSVCVPITETLKTLRAQILHRPNIELMEEVLITRIFRSGESGWAASALDLATGKFFAIKATAIVLATGGLVGELYTHSSNNPFGVRTDASGTGHVMAYRVGAELIDMEMIQFVPLPANARCLHLRYFPDFWAGPYRNGSGEVIESNISSYHGESYAYRFVQKLYRELEKRSGPIMVDQRDLGEPDPPLPIQCWEQRRKLFKSLGISPRENRIELLIGSHFGMGGIRVNRKTETSLSGLYAAGEIMGGVHGAMRLSGYSLTQMIVFGIEAGKQSAHFALARESEESVPDDEIEAERERVYQLLKPKQNPLPVSELKKRLQKIMGDHVFVVRNRAGLIEAIHQIEALRNEVPRLSAPNFKRVNLDWVRSLEFCLMLEAAEIIARSALAREESRGFHYRSDFPEEDPRSLKHTVARMEKDHLRIDSAAVVTEMMKPTE